MNMNFREAFKLMKHGIPIKLPSWGGYWYWDEEKQTIIMHTKDRAELDIRETDRVEYTLGNVMSDEWQIATADNCPELGGIALFSFSDAVRYLKRGLKVSRTGWNGKEMYLFLSPAVGCQMYKQYTGKEINDLQPFIVMKTTDGTLVPWVASQTDVLTEDWFFVE